MLPKSRGPARLVIARQHPRAACRLFSSAPTPASPLPQTELGNRPSAFVTHKGSQYYQWPQEYDAKAEKAAQRAKAERIAEWAPVPDPNKDGYKGLSLYEVCAEYLIKNGPTKINEMWFHVKSKGMVSTRRELRCWIDQEYVNKLERMRDKQKVDPLPWETRDRWVDMMQVCRRWRYRHKGIKKKRLKANLKDEGSLDNPGYNIPKNLPLVCMPNPTPLDAGDEEQLVFDLNPYRRVELISAHRERMTRRDEEEAEGYNVVDDPDMWWFQVLDPDWYYKHAYEGPVSTEQLIKMRKEGDIKAVTRVWNFQLLRYWQKFRDVPELNPKLQAKISEE